MTTNALIHEASPYLRQHAHNPVDWLPWSPAAFDKARTEDKPVFLSVGYAACHWCHVMAHESFENESVAAYLNEHFVPVKVDREERPDVDHHFMQAVQGITGHGGWPLSVFLTPELKPFFGGTYWPPAPRWGRPGFLEVLRAVSDAWKQRRSEINDTAREIHAALESTQPEPPAAGAVSPEWLARAVATAQRHFDEVYGGFGPAPKFPHAMELHLLLWEWARTGHDRAGQMVIYTLEHMARGGIHDQIGGGFHRYSTDARWLVPHFEKMLYDNALLAPVYLDAYRRTGNREFLNTAVNTLDWTLREMRAEGGGFVSSLDADTEGEEGRFYLWTPAEVSAVLGEDRGSRFSRIFAISDTGSFDGGRSVLSQPQPLAVWAEQYGIPVERLEAELAADRAAMLAARDRRVRPARDEKVLTDWNGLMLTALVRGFAVTGNEDYLRAAQSIADRLLKPFDERGILVHSQLGDRTQEIQLLLDYAALACGLLDLFLADGRRCWFDGSVALVRKLDELFANPGGSYFMSVEAVAGQRPVDPSDGALPAGTSLASNVMARLYHLTGDTWYSERANAQLLAIARPTAQAPTAFAQALVSVELLLNSPPQLLLVADSDRQLWNAAQTVYVPGLMTVWLPDSSSAPDALAPLLRGIEVRNGRPVAYLCHNFVCNLPTSSPDELRAALASAAESAGTPAS